MADIDIFKNEFVPNIESFNKLSYTTWKNNNPLEAQKYEAYRDAIIAGQSPAPPTLITKFGQALVAAGQLVQQSTPLPPLNPDQSLSAPTQVVT